MSGEAKTGDDAEFEASASGQYRKADAFGDVSDADLKQAESLADDAIREAEAGSAEPALMGARHDVFLAEQRAAICHCLAVVAGNADDARFQWESDVPRLDPSTQLVVAFSSDNQTCDDEPEGSLGAAYRGYVKSGPNVIVMVEAARAGKPTISGAIIPRPQPDGKLFIKPRSAAVPWGRALDGGSPCEIREAAPMATLVVPDAPSESASGARVTPAVSNDESVAAFTRNADARVDEETPPPEFDEFETTPNEWEQGAQSDRDGFYLGLLGGAGPSTLSLSSEGTSQSADFTGLAIGFDLLLGGSPLPDLAIGAVLGGASAANPTFTVPGLDSADAAANQLPAQFGVNSSSGDEIVFEGSNMNFFRAAAFADWYLLNDANLHLLLELGYLASFFSGNVGGDSISGPSFGGGLGYDFWLSRHSSLGLLARFLFAPLTDSTSNVSYTALLPSLNVSYAYH